MHWILTLMACGGPAEPGYAVTGVVVEVSATDEVIVQHDEIPGFMDAMTMPFHVRDPALIAGLEPGDVIAGRLEVGPQGGFLTQLEVTGSGPAPETVDFGPAPLRLGQQLPATEIIFQDGTRGTIGKGFGQPLVLTFLYTRCPLPDFCPATVSKLAALQESLPNGAQMLAVTIDPTNDTPEVLTAFAKSSSADPAKWRFGIAPSLADLALYAGLPIIEKEGQILHAKRVLLFDAEGRLTARHDDLLFPIDAAVKLLEAP